MATQPGDKVKLETIASRKSIPWTTRYEDFAVVVRVTAPTGTRTESSRSGGADLVAVLDISGRMNEENKLESMKQAMIFVIDHLGPDDRLSVVSFNDQVQRRTEVSVMSDENRAIARTEVNKLTAGGGTNLSAATEEAATILGQRGDEERSNRVGRIILFSSGDDDANPGQNTSPEIEAEAFGLSADHNLSALSYIADKTSGVYSYVNQDVDKIKDARSIGGLMSLDTATGVQIDLQAHEGVAISSLESGGHRVSVGPDGRQTLTIYIHDLYAGEQKSFIVYLTVPEGKEELLTVSGWYRDPENSNDAAYNGQLDGSEVSVLRPNEATPADETICPEVAAGLARPRLTKGDVSAITAEHPTKGSPSKSGYFQDNPMEKMLDDKVENPAQGGVVEEQEKTIPDENQDMPNAPQQVDIPAEQPDKLGKVKIMLVKVITWARSNPYSLALPCVALLLLAAMLLMLHVDAPAAGMITTSASKKGDGAGDMSSSSLGISQHPGWPKMEKSLGLIMLDQMEDPRITSFLYRASIEDMSHTMNRYIYLALVHASVLGSRYGPVVVSAKDVSLLEQTVERLESEKEELRVKIETFVEDKVEEDMATATADCAASKEKNEALERANTRISELERQLQDKKAFADSLLSEVANADAHLKTCGQRVDMLEVKVRETEGAVADKGSYS